MRRFGSLIGVSAGLASWGLAVWPPECTPVTGDSEVFCSRLWSAPLGGMLIGSIALWRLISGAPRRARISVGSIVVAFSLMFLGNVGEYWFAYGLPHQGGPGAAVRGVLWMAVLVGWLLALLGSTAAGLVFVQARVGRPITWSPLAIGLVGLAVGAVGLMTAWPDGAKVSSWPTAREGADR